MLQELLIYDTFARGAGVHVLVFFLLPEGFYLLCTYEEKQSLNSVLGMASV